MQHPQKIDMAFARKLLEPGWAGSLSNSEVAFVSRELGRSPRLRRKWGYIETMIKGVPIPASNIRRIAKHGVW